MGKKYFGLVLLGLCALHASAQLLVTSNNNATQLAQIIAGPGVTISNATTNCSSDAGGAASGSFTCASCNLGLDSGIILTTGYATNAEGPNNTDANKEWGVNPGDPDIANLIGLPVTDLWDPCVLQFDLQALGDSLQFQYVFGSEEYPDYACTTFNDAFGFFISGPGITGAPDIALVPGTNVPVSINTINGGPGYQTVNFGNSCGTTYPQYYINNGTSDDAFGNDVFSPPNSTSSYYIQYNGFTTVLTASIGGLQPCQTYHLKLAIDDVGDDELDSGVFIEANSLTSDVVKLDTPKTSEPQVTTAVRGCVDGIFPLQFPHPVSHNTTVYFKIGGTAVNGTDYTTIADSLVFSTGDSIENVTIHPIGTSVNDTETVELYLYTLCDSTVPYDSATIYIIDSLNLTVTPKTDTICPGDTVQLLATGGVNYSWTPTNGLSGTTIANPLAVPASTTTYKCTTSIGTCVVSDTSRITVLTVPPFTVNAGPNDTSCNGVGVQLDAVVNGNPVNGNAFTYNWTPTVGLTNPNIANPLASPASPTEYVVQVASGNCKSTDSLLVVFGNITGNAAETNTLCPTSTDGSASMTVNGTAPYTYHWNSGQTSQTITGLADGTYTVTATDHSGCTVTGSATVSSPPAIYFNPPVINNITCSGLANGSITETASGGSGSFTYLWSNNDTGSTISNLSPQPYSVTVTDANACSDDTTLAVTQPLVLQMADTVNNVTCNGFNNGSIHLGITGGTTPYTFSWNPAAGTQNIAGLSPGNYAVTVTDSNNCTISQAFVITQPAVFSISTTPTNVTCFGFKNGAIQVTPTGGTPLYTFDWSDGSGSQNRDSLIAGTYNVTATDINSCTASATNTLTQPPSDLFNQPVIQNVSCYGGSNGSITITASGGPGGFTYLWSTGSTSGTATGLSAYVSYSVTSTDANGCTSDTSLSLTSPTADSIALAVSNVTCFGDSNGSITATVSGGTPGYTYAWSNGSTSAANTALLIGTYRLTVTDNAACTATAAATVTQPGLLTATTSVSNVACFGGSTGAIDLLISGGTQPDTYLWSNNAHTQNITNLPAGNYSVTVTDSLLCIASATATVTQPAAALAISDSIINVTCFGGNNGAIYTMVTGGSTPYSYNWGGGIATPNLTNLPVGNYTVLVTDSAGCLDSLSATITSPSAVHFNAPVIANAKCYGAHDGSIYITAAGGNGAFTYNWSNNDSTDTATNLAANVVYKVTATDKLGCTADTSLSLTQPPKLVLTPSETDVKCFGDSNGTAAVLASGGVPPYSFLWSTGQTNPNINGLAYGGYSVTATDANNCSASTATAIGQPARLKVLIDSFAGPTCTYNANGYIFGSGNGGTLPYQYNLLLNGASLGTNADGEFNNLTEGEYTLYLTDSNNCFTTNSVSLFLPPADSFNITTNPTSCYGEQYNDGIIHITPLTLENAPYLFSVDGGNQQYSGDFYDLSAGTHQIVIYNYNDCVTDTFAVVIQPAEGLASILPADTTLQLGQTIQLASQFGPYSDTSITSYNWVPSTGLSCVDCPAPVVNSYSHVNEYTLTIMYNSGCVAVASAKIIVIGKEPVFIPNAFSPNGDGVDDQFLIYGTGIKTVDMKIFNRWGEKVFDSGDQFLGWDGTFKGQLQEPGVYVYEAQITFLDNTTILRTGSVTLLR